MKRVFALFVTFMLSVTLIGCSNNKEKNYVKSSEDQQQETNVSNISFEENTKERIIDYTISYDGEGLLGVKEIDGLMSLFRLDLITSFDELTEICTEYNNKAFLSSNNLAYNEDFFENNILIMYSFETGHIENTTVKNVILNDETLFVNLEQSEKEGFFTAEAFYWTINIVVKKQDVGTIKQVKINYQ